MALRKLPSAGSMLIGKSWLRDKSPDSSLGQKAAAYLNTNILRAKKKLGMGLNKTEKKGRKQKTKNKMMKTNLSTVVNVATKTLENQKPFDIKSTIKVASKSIH